ncbi:MAG: ABC transporter permease [Planctomycetes bacterium]|nr:ABC transporter permease [Planctomycetota bacterium]
MELPRNFNIAVQTLLLNKFRSVLTMVGIAVGIGITIIFVSMGQSAQGFITAQIQSMGFGSNALVVHPGEMDPPIEPSKLTYDDAEQVKNRIPEVIDVIPVVIGSRNARFGNKEDRTMVQGLTANYPRLVNHKVAEGKFFSDIDVDSRRRVCVLGKTIRNKLFGAFSPIGEKIWIGTTKFTCIGEMEEKGEMLGFNMDDIILIPITTAQSLLGTKKILEMVVWAKEEKDLPIIREKIKDMLMKRHKGEDDFHFHTQDEMLSILGTIINALTGFIVAMAALSLLVGALGITNIMLGSLAHRTREIGIRKALGAKDSDIRRQFLLEAGFIGIIGGIIGVGCGSAVSFVVLTLIGMPVWIPWWIIVSALIFCTGIGLVAGVFPAVRAARLSPMEALRYE